MGAHDFENNKVPLFWSKTGKVNTSMSASAKLASVTARLLPYVTLAYTLWYDQVTSQ